MVEMVETATILRTATAASFVLLDEIGRGTSTFDGLAIAIAVAEYMHDRLQCRAMFATHYHELTALAKTHAGIVNACMAVRKQDNRIVFLRRLVSGAATRSYGIEVARLAGIPDEVLARADAVLAELEHDAGPKANASGLKSTTRHPTPPVGKKSEGHRDTLGQLTLFAGSPPSVSTPLSCHATAPGPAMSPLVEQLAQLKPLQMTPMQALAMLSELQEAAAACLRKAKKTGIRTA